MVLWRGGIVKPEYFLGCGYQVLFYIQQVPCAQKTEPAAGVGCTEVDNFNMGDSNHELNQFAQRIRQQSKVLKSQRRPAPCQSDPAGSGRADP